MARPVRRHRNPRPLRRALGGDPARPRSPTGSANGGVVSVAAEEAHPADPGDDPAASPRSCHRSHLVRAPERRGGPRAGHRSQVLPATASHLPHGDGRGPDSEESVLDPRGRPGAFGRAAHAHVAQVEALAGAVQVRWRALVLLAAWCGLRFGERPRSPERTSISRRAWSTSEHRPSPCPGGVGTRGHPSRRPGSARWPSRRTSWPICGPTYEDFVDTGGSALVFLGPNGAPLDNGNFNRHRVATCVRRRGRPRRDPPARSSRRVGHPRGPSGGDDPGADAPSGPSRVPSFSWCLLRRPRGRSGPRR